MCWEHILQGFLLAPVDEEKQNRTEILFRLIQFLIFHNI